MIEQQPTVWADGYGVWHVTVPISVPWFRADGSTSRQAMHDEMHANAWQAIWHEIEQRDAHALPDALTLVYVGPTARGGVEYREATALDYPPGYEPDVPIMHAGYPDNMGQDGDAPSYVMGG